MASSETDFKFWIPVTCAAVVLSMAVLYMLRPAQSPGASAGPLQNPEAQGASDKGPHPADSAAHYGKNYTTPPTPGSTLQMQHNGGSHRVLLTHVPYPVNLLVDAGELNSADPASRPRVLDVRPWEQYKGGHVQGAIWVNLGEWINAFTANQPAAAWQAKIGALGIDLNSKLVICDDGSCREAACARWILRYWGADDVRLLNGGWHAWLSAGAHQVKFAPAVRPLAVELRPNHARAGDKDTAFLALQTGSAQVIDSRCLDKSQTTQFSGMSQSVKRLGWPEVVDWQQERFKPAKELGRLFDTLGIAPAQPAVVYGRSLQEAATLAFALEMMGCQKICIYFPGWDE